MCGRYRLSRRKQLVEEYFDVSSDCDDWSPRYNVAPTQPVPVIRQHPKEPRRDLSLMRWGLIPSWSKDASGSAKMINARSETASQLPAFREAIQLRRCLIPADGFYEWKRAGSARQPFCFEVEQGQLFAFAGLWDRWRNLDGQWVRSCSILTTTANAVTSPVHGRMPVILERCDYDLWLDPSMKEPAVTPAELDAWLGKQSGKPVHVATEGTDLMAELKRGLSFVRNEKPAQKRTDKKGKRR
ncbi:MAG TPA: SOS response-associated peptidase [Candidatus Sulfotelmatobacter sp.]|nr:SOS response-associated peptidase [Candidatus Sulfotelmatobacter sp.]